MTDAPQQASWGELLSGRNGLRSLAVAGGVALHAINVYIVTTILPSIVADIGGLDVYAWNMTLFVAASILSSALSAKVNDVFGLKNGFLVAIVIFSVGTAVCGLAPSMPVMLTGRTIQGAGGGLLLGLCYSSIRVVFPERLWTRAMGLASSMWGVSTLSGPAIGGLFAQSGHWRWAFGVILPCAAGLAWLVIRQINADTATRTGAPTQRVSVALGKIALIVLSVLVVSVGGLSSHVLVNAVGIVAGLAIAVWVARLDQHPRVRFLPEGSYSVRQTMGSIYACVCLMSVAITVEIFVPYFLQVIHGYQPLAAGYLTSLMSIGWTTGSLTSSGRSPAAARVFMRAGPAVTCLSLALLAVFVPQADLAPYGGVYVMMAPLVGVGLGIGMCWPHLLSQVFRSAPSGQESIASSAMITVQLYALALGSTLGGMVVNAAGLTDPGGVPGASHAAQALFMLFCVAPGCAFLVMRRVVQAKRQAELAAATQ